MWGYVRGHTNGNPRGPVDQKVWDPRREYRWLKSCIVVVRNEVDCLLVDVGKQLFGKFREPGLRIPISSSWVTVHGPEVTLSIHKYVSHVEILRHPNHGIVNRTITVGMILFQNFADHACALGILLVMQKTFAKHSVKYTPVHGLQAIAHVG